MASTRPKKGDEVEISVETLSLNKVVIIIGTTGTGKSTIINMLFNNEFTKDACEQPCLVGSMANSVTKEPQWLFSPHHDGRAYGDTIGLGDPSLTDLEICKGIKRFLKMFGLGVHCIIVVAKYGRLSSADRCNLKLISKVFDNSWPNNSIMVLTHYDGEEIGPKAQERAIQHWLEKDREINEFVSMIGRRVILTDNSLGRHEEANRPYRENCLKMLNNFINECSTVVAPCTTDFVEILKFILEFNFSTYREKNAKKRVQNVVKFLESAKVKTPIIQCPICMDEMQFDNMAKTGCDHVFHADCIDKTIKKVGKICPTCRRPIKKISIFETWVKLQY